MGLPVLVNGRGNVHLIHPGEQQRDAVHPLNRCLFHEVPPGVIAIPQESYAVLGGLAKITNLSDHGRKVSDKIDSHPAYMGTPQTARGSTPRHW
jgi:hypothetical protein